MAFSYAYTNVGGTGDRTTIVDRGIAPITVTSTLTISGGGAFSNLCDGGFGNNTADSIQITSVAVSGLEIKFDCSGIGAKVIKEFKFYQSTSDSHGVWDFKGSMDDSSYTTLQASITLGGATTQTQTIANTNKYLFYKLVGVSGNTNATPWWQEFEFKISGNPTVEYGDRTATATATTTFASSGGTVSNFIDGDMTNNSTGSYGFTGEAATGKYVQVDFGASNKFRCTGFTFWEQTNNSHGTFNFDGSNDAAAWTTLKTGFTLGGAAAVSSHARNRYDVTNTTQYRYYRLIGTAGTTSGTPWLQELEFEEEEVPAAALLLLAHQVLPAASQAFTLSGITKRLVAAQTLPLPTQALAFVPTRHLVSAKTLAVPDQLMGLAVVHKLVAAQTLPAPTQQFRINILGLRALQTINLLPVSTMTVTHTAGGAAAARSKGDIIIEARPRQAL